MTEKDDIFTILSNRDNLLHVFFYILWMKGKNSALTNICIPDTVVMSHSRAVDWFFTSKDGTIKRRSRQKLSSNYLIDFFGKVKKTSSGACAVVMERIPDLEEGMTTTAVALPTLRSLIAEGPLSGTVQTFVDPKPECGTYNNNLLVANWTPNVFYVERRQNGNNMLNDRLSLQDRTTVDETSRFVTVTPLVSTRTAGQIEVMCQTVAEYIENVQNCKVANLMLHVRIDEHDKMWLLYCSAMRVTRPGPPPQSRMVTLSAHAISAAAEKPTSRQLVRAEPKGPSLVSCALCRRENPREECSNLPQKHILFPLSVLSFFSAHPPGTAYSEEAVEDDDVPAHVLLLNETMTASEYHRVGKTSRWLDKLVTLCPNCVSGMECITASLKVGLDGAIRVPENGEHSLMLGAAVDASFVEHSHRRSLNRLRHHIQGFSSAEENPESIAWEEASHSSNAAPIYTYDAEGRAVASSSTAKPVVPKCSGQSSSKLPAVQKKGALDPNQLAGALGRVQAETREHRRAPGSRTKTPTSTPA